VRVPLIVIASSPLHPLLTRNAFIGTCCPGRASWIVSDVAAAAAGHEGTKCWYAPSKSKMMDADASRDAGREITTVSTTNRSAPADAFSRRSERYRARAVARARSAGEARSILIWGAPMRIDEAWEEMFAGRERDAK